MTGALDTVFKDLSEKVLKYRQHILQSQVCWKDWAGRERKRPDQCPDHMKYDGKHWCTRDNSVALLESSASRKKPRGAVAPRCAEDSVFSEQKRSWCYKDCPQGSAPSGTRCKSICMGNYPIDSALVCGKSPGTIRAAILEMTVGTLRQVVSVGSSLLLGSELAEALPGMAAALADVGKGFAHRKCPIMWQ